MLNNSKCSFDQSKTDFDQIYKTDDFDEFKDSIYINSVPDFPNKYPRMKNTSFSCGKKMGGSDHFKYDMVDENMVKISKSLVVIKKTNYDLEVVKTCDCKQVLIGKYH